MESVSLLTPSTLEEAMEALHQYGDRGKIIAGGVDVLSLMKDGVYEPRKPIEVLIDITKIPGLDKIRFDADKGLTIGSLTKICDVASSLVIRHDYTALAEAAGHVASPQIRNMGTVGGNILQEVWCWYLRNGYKCYKSNGNRCFAAIGANQNYFSLTGGTMCIAAHPSDMATALSAFDANVKIVGVDGPVSMTLDELIPGMDLVCGEVRSHRLRNDQIVSEIEVASPKQEMKSSFVKISLRDTWDFALTSAAVVLSLQGGVIVEAHVVIGGVSTAPYRALEAEHALVGSRINDETATRAAGSAIPDSKIKPLRYNSYKRTLVRTVVKRAVLRLRTA